ncbi:aspartate racemase/maleate isomerase family protein [Streptomyces cavernicola]|uniref:Arylmalonate decarboxylase n=1 Tax=Streptomyces cavernicola TaxID=3043613 RepID=A0ABT6S557_9ACTN|nr:hypothetical protein [Streptomyces sp. B-S-A6]MDI3403231.1 hypothetical protein [Streptomyces sp. B-S-A6]
MRTKAEAEEQFLKEQGIEVVTHRGIPCATPKEQALIEPGKWLDLASSLDPSTIDGVLLSCAGIRIADQIQHIEDRLGLPVVTSNQALLWHLLRTLDIPARPSGYGALLAGRFE